VNTRFNLGRPWMLSDENTIVTLLGEGWDYQEIATCLGRSRATVKERAWRLLGPSRTRKIADKRPRISISKSELPSRYAEGWRVESFEHDAVVCVWPHKTSCA
jgi:hypothetical protein